MSKIKAITSKPNILVLLILSLALFLRLYKYYDFPVGGETADELAWTMLGSSLIQDKVPTSWSYFKPYENFIYQLRNNEAPLVRPVLDHPPLFSLIPGIAQSIKHNWQENISIKVIRFPMVFLGVLNVWLLYLVTAKLFSKKTAYLASLILATAPVFIFASRLVVAENLLVTWLLLAIFALINEKLKYRNFLLTIICTLAVLTKISGVVIPLSIFIFGLMTKDYKVSKKAILGLLIGIILFSLYGAFFNWQLFLDILRSQSARDLGLSTIQNRFFLHPTIVRKIFFDGWLTLGLMSIFLFFHSPETKEKKFLIIKVLTVFYLLFILATSGENTFHGWYDFPLYPLFCLMIAFVIKNIFEKKDYLFLGLTWIFVLPLLRVLLVHTGVYQNLSALFLRLLMILGFIPFFTDLFFKNKKYSLVLAKMILLLIFITNVLAVLNFNQESYWISDEFFMPVRVTH